MPREIWFTSDTHWSHAKVITYCKRPFATVQEMDEALIENWNKRVGRYDIVHHLGDVALCSPEKLRRILERLNGEKHLTFGNHDKTARRCFEMWRSMADKRRIFVGKTLVILDHYAHRVWERSHHGSISLYGHSHGNLPGNAQSLDVGVDCWNYAPVNFEEIKARLATLPPYTGYAQQAGGSDHHTPVDL